MFLDLPDPDPSLFVRIRALPSSNKNSEKYLDFYCLVTSLCFFRYVNVYLKKVISKKNKIKIYLGILKVPDEKSRIRIWICTKMSRIHNTDLNYNIILLSCYHVVQACRNFVQLCMEGYYDKAGVGPLECSSVPFLVLLSAFIIIKSFLCQNILCYECGFIRKVLLNLFPRWQAFVLRF
jgi:hypothetical protein